MKRFICMTLTAMMCVAPTIASAKTFSDIQGHWCQSSVEFMSSKFDIAGYSDGTFKPNNKITRAEFYTWLSNFNNVRKTESKSDCVMSASSYSDLGSHWAKGSIDNLMKLGVIDTSYYNGSTFNPNAEITRGEAIVAITRYAINPTMEAEEVTYATNLKDFHDFNDAEKKYISKAYFEGIISGYSDSTMKPKANLTRGEAAAMLNTGFMARERYGLYVDGFDEKENYKESTEEVDKMYLYNHSPEAERQTKEHWMEFDLEWREAHAEEYGMPVTIE